MAKRICKTTRVLVGDVMKSPEIRIETIINQLYPSIVNGYKEKLWTKDEAIDKLQTYKEKGHVIAPLITDPIIRLELEDSLCTGYEKYLGHIELAENDNKRMYV